MRSNKDICAVAESLLAGFKEFRRRHRREDTLMWVFAEIKNNHLCFQGHIEPAIGAAELFPENPILLVDEGTSEDTRDWICNALSMADAGPIAFTLLSCSRKN